MHHLVRKMTIAGLALTLFSGLAVPASAEIVSTDNPSTTRSTSNATYTISSIGLPYNISVDSHGMHQVPWYPDESAQAYSTSTIKDGNFTSAFLTRHKSDIYAPAIIGLMPDLTEPLTLTPNETVLQYLRPIKDISSSLSDADVLSGLQDEYAFNAWLFKALAEEELGTADFKTLQIEYNTTYRNKIITSAAIYGDTNNPASVYDDLFANEGNFTSKAAGTLKTQGGAYHVNQDNPAYTAKQLSQLNPNGAKDAVTKFFTQPMTNLLTKQADGTYQLDGAAVALQIKYGIFAFNTTPSTGTPTPSRTSRPVTVHYVDNHGATLKADQTLTGSLGAPYQAKALDIKGYTLTQTPQNATGTFTDTAQDVTYVYTKTTATGTAADTIAPKGSVIYATKKIGLYQQATFTNRARQQWYANKSRINRPMFLVTGYATSKNGVKRYRVKDINHLSKTDGKTGYVTANAAYTSPVYYAAKHATITVINPKGINAYNKKNLTSQQNHYRQGQALKVKKIVTHNLTTRFVLSNGHYISANKKLVKAGKQTMPQRVQAKTALNRYTTANLTKRNHHYPQKSHARFTVTGWAYSNANNFSKGDTLRYQVAGGYITANPRLVHVLITEK